jgi:hypothetical protein
VIEEEGVERIPGPHCYAFFSGVDAFLEQARTFVHDTVRRLGLGLDSFVAEVGSNEIRLTDRVVNHGFYRTPHMYCYHINIGHPVLDEGARYLAPIEDVVWAAMFNAGWKLPAAN